VYSVNGGRRFCKVQIRWLSKHKKPLIGDIITIISRLILESADARLIIAGTDSDIYKEKADLMRSNGKETAEKMRTEAKDLAAKQRSETDKAYTMAMEKAKKEADALVAAAKDPIQKKLAKVAAEKLLKEADKKATAAKGEGYKLADQTEAKGNQKADQW
jgi:hypothetical protein